MFSIGLIFSYANASKCKDAQYTQTRCYETSKIEGTVIYNNKIYNNVYENLKEIRPIEQRSTIRQTNFTWFATKTRYMEYGEPYFGILVSVDAYRTGSDGWQEPLRVTINSTPGVLVSYEQIRKGSLVIGKTYTYFVKYKKTSQANTYNDINIKGTLTVYGDGFEIKDQVYIN